MIKKIGVKIVLVVVMAVFTTGMIAGTYARYVREASAQGTVKASEFKLDEDTIKSFDLSVELSPTQMKEFEIPVSSQVGVNTMQTVELSGANGVIKPLKYSIFLEDKPIGCKHNRMLVKGTNETVKYKIKVEWPETDNDTEFEGQIEKISFKVKNEQIIWNWRSLEVSPENSGEIKDKLLYLAAHCEGAGAFINWYTPEPDVNYSFKVASMKFDGDNFHIIGENGQQIIYYFSFKDGYYLVQDEKGKILSEKCDLFVTTIDAYWKTLVIRNDVEVVGHTGMLAIGY